MPTIKEQIEQLVKKQKRRVGVAYTHEVPEVVESLRRAAEFAEIVTVGLSVEGFENIPATRENAEQTLIDVYKQKKVEGILRGHGDAYKLRDAVCRELGYKASDLIECGIFQTYQGDVLFMGPISQAQGWTKNSKIETIQGLVTLAKSFEIIPKVGLLTAVRTDSRGRNFFLDQTYEIADDCVEWCAKNGIEAKNYNIELETALAENCNIIIPPNGVAGNQMLRALTYIANQPPLAYPVPALKDAILENMRNETDWYSHLKYLVAFINKSV